MKHDDVKYLDMIPLSKEEMHGRTGKHTTKRRPVKKTLYELRQLMDYIEKRVEEDDKTAIVINIETVDAMYDVVASEFAVGPRDAQKKWVTCLNELKKR